MRYFEAIAPLVLRLGTRTGVVIVLVPPTEHAAVADALDARWPGAERCPLDAALISSASRCIIEGLPGQPARVDAALGRLNDLREALKQQRRTLVLLLSVRELRRFEAVAPDVASVAWGHGRLAFEPKPPADDDDDDDARAALGEWLDASVGRLDLRGFFRTESEDVSFAVADVYEHLEVDDGPSLRRRADEAIAQPPTQSVLLGQPGSGKSFFLRWLALSARRAPACMGMERAWAVLIPLAALDGLAGEQPLLDLIELFLLEQAPRAGHAFRRALAERRVLLLLDGLDEVGDADARKGAAREIDALAAAGVALVVTSRVAGYEEAPTQLRVLHLAPLSDEGVRSLLIRWMGLYFVQSRGPDSGQLGEREGARLASDVLGNAQLRELARSPLLLTVLAVIHRAGLSLPEQRVELYAHATQVLVERWNQVRSLAHTAGPVMKAVDAVRLLGPVAIDLLRHGGRAAISEGRLRSLIAAGLAAGNIRGITSADHAIDVFRRSLGLLVEQSPGWYGFLHLTFVEYFAARELIRSGELEALVRDDRRAFLPEWREVLLLASGELGVLRADDRRLRAVVEALIASARRRRGQPSVVVPALLGGILADDPSLEQATGEALIHALIPIFWFNRAYRRPDDVAEEALRLGARIRRGRFRAAFTALARQAFEAPRTMRLLLRNTWSQEFVIRFRWWLAQQELDDSYFLEAWGAHGSGPRVTSPTQLVSFVGGVRRRTYWVSSRLIARAAEGQHRWTLRYPSPRPPHWTTVPLAEFTPDPAATYTEVRLREDPQDVELYHAP